MLIVPLRLTKQSTPTTVCLLGALRATTRNVHVVRSRSPVPHNWRAASEDDGSQRVGVVEGRGRSLECFLAGAEALTGLRREACVRLEIENLERREMFTNFAIDVEVPHIAFAGDEVTYTVNVENLNPNRAAVAEFELPLDGVVWTMNGERLPSGKGEIGIPQSGEFVATGRVPVDVEYFQLYGEVGLRDEGSRSIVRETTVVLDRFVDEWTVDFLVSDVVGLRHEQSDSSWFHSLVPAGDLNGDGFDDAHLNYVNRRVYLVDGEYTYDWQRRRQTLFGGAEKLPNYLLERDDEVIEIWEGLKDNPLPEDIPLRFRGAAFSSSGLLPVGDVDGDGFADLVLGSPFDIRNEGTATVFFGPDFRDNVVIIGGSDAGQPGTETFFGAYAGSVGDLNGDGTNDFYILGSAYGNDALYIFHGRQFDRYLVGDIDRDGNVGFDDFSILAAHFGSEGHDSQRR